MQYFTPNEIAGWSAHSLRRRADALVTMSPKIDHRRRDRSVPKNPNVFRLRDSAPMRNFAIVVMSLVPALALAQTATKAAPAGKAAAPAAPKDAAAAKPPAPPAQPAAPPEVKATVDAFKGNWKFDSTMSFTGIPGMDKPVAVKGM